MASATVKNFNEIPREKGPKKVIDIFENSRLEQSVDFCVNFIDDET